MAIITAAGLSDLYNQRAFNKNGSTVTLKKISETEWLLFGDLAEGDSEGFPYGEVPEPPQFPYDIGDLIIHLDAGSLEGATDGSLVDSWADISPSNHVVAQPTSTKIPVYRETGIQGRPAVEFDGIDDNLSGSFGITYGQPNTVFAVVQFLTVPPNDAYPWMDGNSATNRHWMGSTTLSRVGIWADTPFLDSGIDKSTRPMVVRGVFNGGGGNSSVHVLGDQYDGSTGSQGWSGVTLGSRWDGDRNVHIRIAEIIAYNRILDDSEAARVDDYLSEKYSLHLPIDLFGSFGSGGKWAYGALASNGSIYGTPYQTGSILKLDPVSRTYTTFDGPGSSNNQWIGMVESTDGRLFCIPARNPNVLVIDPADDSYTTFPAADYNEYYGGALANNGMIYCCPFSRNTVLKIDAQNNTSSTIGPVSTETSGSDGQWGWFTKDPVSGKLYAAPRNEPSVLVVDPETDTISYITTNVPAGTRKYTGGLVASTGEIWMIPRDSTTFLVVDPSTDTARTVGNIPVGGDKWNGGSVAGDWVVMYPRSYDKIVAVNAVTEEIRFIETHRYDANKWVGSVDAGGESFLIPYFSSSIGVVDLDDLGLS